MNAAVPPINAAVPPTFSFRDRRVAGPIAAQAELDASWAPDRLPRTTGVGYSWRLQLPFGAELPLFQRYRATATPPPDAHAALEVLRAMTAASGIAELSLLKRDADFGGTARWRLEGQRRFRAAPAATAPVAVRDTLLAAQLATATMLRTLWEMGDRST